MRIKGPFARASVVAVAVLVITSSTASPAGAAPDPVTVSALSAGGSVVAQARYYNNSSSTTNQLCVIAVNSGHAIAYVKNGSGVNIHTIDEWGGDGLFECYYIHNVPHGTKRGLSVEYYLADGTRYAYSPVEYFWTN